MDKDFGELIFNSGLSHYGVLLLRLDDSNGEEKVETIKEIITKHESSLSNSFCVYQNSRQNTRNFYQEEKLMRNLTEASLNMLSKILLTKQYLILRKPNYIQMNFLGI